MSKPVQLRLPELLVLASPLAAATAAPAQSPSRSAGSMSLRRTLSTRLELSSVALSGTRKAYARSTVATASSAS